MPGKSNEQLEKEHKSLTQKPEDLKDTDVEEEYQEGDQKGFRKQTGIKGPSLAYSNPSSSAKGPSNETLEKEQKNTKLKPDELKDTDIEESTKPSGANAKSKL